MANHGHMKYLRTYLLEDAPISEITSNGISILMSKADDDDERRLLLRRAFDVWRHHNEPVSLYGFWDLLRQHWQVLPVNEASAMLTGTVDAILQKPDGGGTHSIMQITMESDHAAAIFRCFGLLLDLDPRRAEELRSTNPQLAKALERYPKGWQSILDEPDAPRARTTPGPNQHRYIVSGNSGRRQYAQALMAGEFELPLEQALAKYREDTEPANPNLALKAFWPATGLYINIFFQMGKRLGESALARLNEVPDPEIRLLAQIEYAAALSGLPELQSMSISQRNTPTERTSGRR